MKQSESKTAIAYYRVSTDNQKEEGTVDLQTDAIQDYCQARNIKLIKTFKDEDVSGGLENRPVFENKLCGEKSCWWLGFGGRPEYLVVDLHPDQWLTQLLESSENFADAVRNLEKAEAITLEKEVNFAKLYKINRMISPETNGPQ